MLLDPRWEKKIADTGIEVVKPAGRPGDPWRDVLRRAADILERDGWTRGAYFRPKVGYCAAGAMNAAIGAHPGDAVHNAELMLAFNQLTIFVGNSITTWNDMVAKDGAQVIRVMRECAEARDERHPA